MRYADDHSWKAYRQRMLDETARFIEWGLKHPELVIEIPAKPVGTGGFPKAVADWFWGTVLSGRIEGGVQKWRHFLMRRRKQRP